MERFEGGKPSEKIEEQKHAAEYKGIFERIRKNPLIRTSVLSLGLAISALGGLEVAERAPGKLAELHEIQREENVAAKKVKILRELGAKEKKLKELFGERGDIGYGAIKKEIWHEADEAVKKREGFSWTAPSRDLEEMSVRKIDAAKHKSAAERRKMENKIDDLKAMDGEKEVVVPHDIVKDILEETFPERWAKEGPRRIGFQKSEDPEALKQLGLPKTWRIVAETSAGESYITFYKQASRQPVDKLINNTLAHEMAHNFDWTNLAVTSFEERMDLLQAIGERIGSKDRLKSDYVETIKNEAKQEERYLKAQEYWAEICAAYFSHPKEMNYKDFKIVDNWMKKFDQKWNVGDKNAERGAIIEAIKQGVYSK
jgi:hypothetical protein